MSIRPITVSKNVQKSFREEKKSGPSNADFKTHPLAIETIRSQPSFSSDLSMKYRGIQEIEKIDAPDDSKHETDSEKLNEIKYTSTYMEEKEKSQEPINLKLKRKRSEEEVIPATKRRREEGHSFHAVSSTIHLPKKIKAESTEPRAWIHTLPISTKDAPYMDYFRQGIKSAEGRVAHESYLKFKVGETVKLHNRKEAILCQITFLHKYSGFEEMLKGEGIINMLPQLSFTPEKNLMEKAVSIYKAFPGAHKANTLGMLAIGLKFVKDL